MTYEIPVTQARAELADLVNRVVYRGERVLLTRHGKAIVALIPVADLERLEDAEQQRPAQVIRLSTEALGQPGDRYQPGPQQFGIAAEHRPHGAEPERPPHPA